MGNKIVKVCQALVLIALLFVQTAHAETGMLRAKVRTSTGAVLINARIVLTGPDGKPLNQVRTGSTGEFALQLPLGEYQLDVNAGGFGALSRIVRIVPGTTFLSLVVEPYPGRFNRRHNALDSTNNLSAIVLDEDILRSTLPDNQQELAKALSGIGNGDLVSGLQQNSFVVNGLAISPQNCFAGVRKRGLHC